MSQFTKLLVANRGEIAVRVMRTAKDLGYRTVAVYSDADAQAPHVLMADEAVCIGPAAVAESYLNMDKIINAAKITGADALHPGYGFLSENAVFAQACADAAITFIGPSAQAIDLMGNKRLAKVAMIAADVPCIKGYQGADQSDAVLFSEAEKIGFPVMVKASAGGGGRGMRLVHKADELAEQIKSARSEALNAFGSDELILEQAVIEPRHIEIQIFADSQGNVVHLGERDCSIQRRHQKVVEEAPSPFVSAELRQRMGDAAVRVAQACAYLGAGTVEFLVDEQGLFYFLEMNTRLQVEHPVTEMITGLDLVEWQLNVAAGQPLPLTQAQVALTGHAIEVRIYAEDPKQNFLPQTGLLHRLDCPVGQGVRIDSGFNAGQNVSPFYDPMLAKVICYGADREQARRRLVCTLEDIIILGISTNRLFLKDIISSGAFSGEAVTTAFIEQHMGELSVKTPPSEFALAVAGLLFFCQGGDVSNPWRRASANSYQYTFAIDGETFLVGLKQTDQQFSLSVAQNLLEIQLLSVDAQHCTFVFQGIRQSLAYHLTEDTLYIDDGADHYCINDITHKPADSSAGAGNGQAVAIMDGAIVEVPVEVGLSVSVGQTLVVLEAMKMEHPIKANIDGVVTAVNVTAGDQVKAKQLLVEVGPLAPE